jgi:hypothetical protein
VALAADETNLSARTSAPVTCLNVTRKGTASRIWELYGDVKTNRLEIGVERSYPEWDRIFDKNCWARSVPGELKKSALGRSSTISPWSINITRLATSLANPIS